MVRRDDRKGLYLVTRVDRQQKVADLRFWEGLREMVEEHVPLKFIRPVSQEASRLIESFLHS